MKFRRGQDRRRLLLLAESGLCTVTDSIVGALSAAQTFTHNADGIMQYDFDTLQSSGNTTIRFRSQDADNCWRIVITSGGDLILQERVGGGNTNRGLASSVLSGGEVISVVFNGTTITGYYDGTQAWSYTSASNFQTQTDGAVVAIGTGGAASDLYTYEYSAGCLTSLGLS